MSNISAALETAGERRSQRYKPSFTHVGRNVTSTILSVLNELRSDAGQSTADPDVLAQRTSSLLALGQLQRPTGSLAPAKSSATSQSYVRCPKVIAWVLQTAAGKCEACDAPAPFFLPSGRPYLEVHHVRHLADKGPDVVENAVALCPTCHRALHHAADATKRRDKLVRKVKRLQLF